MDEIQQLIQLHRQTKFKSERFLDAFLPEGTQIRRLYDSYISDLNTLQQNFTSEATLSVVKNQLKERLLLMVLFLNTGESDFQEKHKAYKECCRRWSAVQVLLEKQNWDIIERICSQLLRHTYQFDLTALRVDILRFLRNNITSFKNTDWRADIIKTEIETALMLLEQENYLEDKLAGFKSKYTFERHDWTDAHMEEVRFIAAKNKSLYVQNLCKKIEIYHFLHKGEYLQALYLAEQVLNYLEHKAQYKDAIAECHFRFLHTITLFHAGRYQACITASNELLECPDTGEQVYFSLQFQILWSYLSQNLLADAREQVQLIAGHEGFMRQSPRNGELLSLCGLYLNFYTYARVPESWPEKRREALVTLQQFKVLNTEKRGMNIAIRIIEYLYALWDNHQSAIFDTEEAMAKYRNRYLSQKTHGRSYWFWRVLETIPRASLEAHKLSAMSQSFQAEIRTTLPASNYQIGGVEIVPYEALCDSVVETLKRSTYKR